MSSVPWPRIKEIFSQLLTTDAAGREAILLECAATPGLRTEVLSLLAAHEQDSQSLTDTGRAVHEAGDLMRTKLASGIMLGKYQIGRLIESGGMGSVYEALDTLLNRAVALKVLQQELPSPGMRQRFDDECRMLARLRHPGIAQVYDSGTHRSELTGALMPYFAMELVAGARPIDQWRKETSPPISRVLGVFIAVCEAIQHGHQRSIIHRDIKPANILMDDAGDPKVIDFGVARTIADSGVHNNPAQIVGTLRYMSPEACAGDVLDIDVRTDVYSLGVVLYELLSGEVPHRVDSLPLTQALEQIRTREPVRLAQLAPSLSGDLDLIVHKAIHRDRDQRYSSVAELAEDVRRYLRSEPISARTSDVFYQARLFTRRNRLLVFASASVCVAVVLGMIGLFVGLSHARRATQEAQLQSARASRTSEFLINTLRSANPVLASSKEGTLWDTDLSPEGPGPGWGFAGRPGEIATAHNLISLAADKVKDQFLDDPVLRAEILNMLASTLRETGLDPRTQAFSEEALKLNEEAFGPLDRRTIQSHLDCAHEWWLKSSPIEAMKHYRIAQETSRKAFGPLEPIARSCNAAYARILMYAERNRKEGERILREQYRLVEEHFGPSSRELAVEKIRLGEFLGATDEGMNFLKSAKAYLEEQNQGQSVLWAETVYRLAENCATDCARQREAIRYYLDACTVFDARFGERNPWSITSYGRISTCYLRMDRAADAVPFAKIVWDAARLRYQEGTIGLHISKGAYARVLVQAGHDLEQGEQLSREAVAGIVAVDPAVSADWAVFFTAVRAQALRGLGRAKEGLAVVEEQIKVEPDRMNPAWAYAFLQNERAECLAVMGRTDAAWQASGIALRTATAGFTETLDQCHLVNIEVRKTASRLGVLR